MNEKLKPIDNFTRLARYSMYLSLVGALSYIITFPAGIYYGFMMSAIGTAGGILSKPYAEKKRSAKIAIVVGVINIAICLLAFHGLQSMYDSLKDPVLGPQVTEFVKYTLEQHGISLETFVQIMQPL